MKILVLSDSHQTMKYMLAAIEKERPQYIIHLGDHTKDADQLKAMFPMLPILSIRGNCDYDFTAQEQVLSIYDGVRVLSVHGHRYGVKSGLLRYSLAAKECEADVALFGHTHHAVCEFYDGLWMMNPGSCGYCAAPSYGLIEILDGKVECSIKRIDDLR